MTVAEIIQDVAQRLGVDPLLALAIAMQESGLNPTAVGDGGTSYGLFQLHQGGELGNLTPSQAFDPTTNALTALQQVASVEHAHPDWSPGEIAAAAQRPADPNTYASSVNRIYSSLLGQPQYGGGGATGAPVANVGGSMGAPADAQLAGLSLGGAASKLAPLGVAGAVLEWLLNPAVLHTALFVVVGGALVLVGVKVLTGQGPAIVKVQGRPG